MKINQHPAHPTIISFEQRKNHKMTTFEIPASKLPGLQKKIEALQNKSAKLGLPPVKLTVVDTVKKVANKVYSGGERDLREALQAQYESVRPLSIHYVIEITGAAPVINGYRFLAKLENHGDKNLVFSAVVVDIGEKTVSSSKGEYSASFASGLEIPEIRFNAKILAAYLRGCKNDHITMHYTRADRVVIFTDRSTTRALIMPVINR